MTSEQPAPADRAAVRLSRVSVDRWALVDDAGGLIEAESAAFVSVDQ